jgi:hypothetical protein
MAHQITVIPPHKSGKRFVAQGIFFQSQLAAAGTIHIQYQPFGVKGEIPYRYMIIQILISRSGLLKVVIGLL